MRPRPTGRSTTRKSKRPCSRCQSNECGGWTMSAEGGPPPGAGVRQRLSRAERHDLILAHATDVFGARGYHNVSMDDVAERAGISKALVYQHFESKDELYLAVLKSFTDTLSDA